MIEQLPFVYETLWFRAFVVGATAGLIGVLYRFRLHAVRRRYAAVLGERNRIAWKELVRVEGNYQRHRRHQFQTMAASRIRIEIGATHGDPSAAIYEVRCYREAS